MLSQPARLLSKNSILTKFISISFFDKVLQVTMATGGAPLALTGLATPATGRRGRGAAPAAINPRTVTDFEDITSIPFVFARHPIYPEAHIHMNAIYSDAFMDMEDLFSIATEIYTPFNCPVVTGPFSSTYLLTKRWQ